MSLPVIIRPLRELRQGKLPPLSILERPDAGGEDDGDADEEAYSSFNPYLDFDEPLYADRSADSLSDLYAMLHKKSSRVSHQVYPLMKFPLEEENQRTKLQPKKQARCNA